MISLKRVLVPTDFSKPAELALDYAKSIARVFGARIYVLHVLEDPLPGWKPAGHVVAVPQIRAGMEQDARTQIERLVSEADRNQFQAELVIIWGKPFVEIVRYAKNNEIDLIVMGTHGRGPIIHMLLGSVAERVVRGAPCAVLTVGRAESAE